MSCVHQDKVSEWLFVKRDLIKVSEVSVWLILSLFHIFALQPDLSFPPVRVHRCALTDSPSKQKEHGLWAWIAWGQAPALCLRVSGKIT